MRPYRALVLLLAGACSSRVPTAQSDPTPSSRAPAAGAWKIAFGLDSTRGLGPGAAAWIPSTDRSKRVFGRLWLSDSSVGPGARAATLEIDFGPLLGRPMSCFASGSSGVQVVEDHDRTYLRFTPGAADCGFSGQAESRRDSLTGTWAEESFIGPVAAGRFWMSRR